MKRIIGLIILLSISVVSGVVSAQTVVKEIYEETFHYDLSDIPIKSCNVQENWESGECDYLYACYFIAPKEATSLEYAVQKECFEVTDSSAVDIKVTFAPPRGKIYAVVPFIVKVHYTYNYDTYEWEENVTIVKKYATSIVSLCPEGMILKKNLCFNYTIICLNSMGTNMCDNPYPLYCLDYGAGCNASNPAQICADRDNDMICDEVVSEICSDANHNGVCDSDDVKIRDVGCVDNNHNWVCDDVETEGVFCPTTFQPVCWVNSTNTSHRITFPNKCFAEASGLGYTYEGICEPLLYNLCYKDEDCPPPCEGVTGVCKNPDGKGNRCFYEGECNPRVIQCLKDEDCPAPPCRGITVSCSEDNRCVYTGQCITKPERPISLWDWIKALFEALWKWVLSFLGWY